MINVKFGFIFVVILKRQISDVAWVTILFCYWVHNDNKNTDSWTFHFLWVLLHRLFMMIADKSTCKHHCWKTYWMKSLKLYELYITKMEIPTQTYKTIIIQHCYKTFISIKYQNVFHLFEKRFAKWRIVEFPMLSEKCECARMYSMVLERNGKVWAFCWGERSSSADHTCVHSWRFLLGVVTKRNVFVDNLELFDVLSSLRLPYDGWHRKLTVLGLFCVSKGMRFAVYCW